MKNILTATFLTCICITGSAQINHGYPIVPVPDWVGGNVLPGDLYSYADNQNLPTKYP